MVLLRPMLPPSPKLLMLPPPPPLRGLGLLNPESPPRLGTPKGASEARRGGRGGSERGQEAAARLSKAFVWMNCGGRRKGEGLRWGGARMARGVGGGIPRKMAAQRRLRTSVKEG